MKFDLQRAFPYPVLRPENNDYVDGDFQTEATFKITGNRGLCVEVAWNLSVPEIQQLIDDYKASFVLVISCRASFLRYIKATKESNFSISFESGELKGDVRVFSFIATKQQIEGFRCEWINKEWGETPFSFELGALLAIDKPQEVYLDTELTKKITSVFHLVQDNNMEKYKWKVDLEDDFVKIRVSPFMKEKIDIARNTKENQALLLNSLYFAAVMQCVTALKNEDNETYSSRRWAKIMQSQIDALSSLDRAESVITQDLLYSPLEKLETYVFSKED